ncbi:MAG: hypothetical protein ACQEVA_07970 [Myxococcota bacterium]
MADDDKKGEGARDERDSLFDDDRDFDEEFTDEHLFDETEFEAEGWSIPRDPDAAKALLKSLEGLVPEVVRKTINAGVGSVGSSEELRALLSDRKLPKEVVTFLLGQVDATKREVVRIISREVRIFLEDLDLGGELAKILTSLALELRMEVRFKANEEAVRPSAKGKVRVKRAEKEAEKQKASDEDEDDKPASRRRWSFRRRRDPEDEEESSEDDPDRQ